MSRSGGTIAGTSACRTGCPKAAPIPTKIAIAMATPTDITSIQIRTPVSSDAARTTNWLPKRSTRRSERSESTPAGRAMKNTGMPSAKLTRPSTLLLSLSSTASQTKANRWTPCASA